MARGLLVMVDVRDYRKLAVFHKADAALLKVHAWSAALPIEERYVLKSQIRRAAISVPANIVEGSARLGEAEYIHFLCMALGSSVELEYLIGVAGRLYPDVMKTGKMLPGELAEVSRMLVALVDSLRLAQVQAQASKRNAQRLKPRA